MSKEIVEHFKVQGMTHWPPKREFPGSEPVLKDDSKKHVKSSDTNPPHKVGNQTIQIATMIIRAPRHE
jgi:hypothetical protein